MHVEILPNEKRLYKQVCPIFIERTLRVLREIATKLGVHKCFLELKVWNSDVNHFIFTLPHGREIHVFTSSEPPIIGAKVGTLDSFEDSLEETLQSILSDEVKVLHEPARTVIRLSCRDLVYVPALSFSGRNIRKLMNILKSIYSSEWPQIDDVIIELSQAASLLW